MKYVNVVCAIIRNDENKVFACRRGPGRVLNGKWEFPGGKIEANESNEETIVREIKEELNSIIEPIRYIGVNYHEYTDIDTPFSITLYAYECKLIEGSLALSEHTEKKWLSLDELKLLDLAEADKPFIDMIEE